MFSPRFAVTCSSSPGLLLHHMNPHSTFSMQATILVSIGGSGTLNTYVNISSSLKLKPWHMCAQDASFCTRQRQ